jgi:ABC-type transporter Mla subunit MlaD
VIGVVRAARRRHQDHYVVRAIFDNASTLVTGEDVKVAGVPVGVITTRRDARQEGRVTLRIDDTDFTPVEDGRECTIGAQG